jgi:replicative DNA helicase
MPTVERTQPHSIEAERALLGSVLMDNEALYIIMERLKREDFFLDAHRMIFDKMLLLSDKPSTIDLVTLSEELGRDGLLEKVGGAAHLASLIDSIPIGTTAGVAEYCKIVKDKSIVRQLINASNNMIARCYEAGNDPEELIDDAQRQIVDIAQEKVQTGFARVKDVPFEDLINPTVTGVETGFVELDQMTSGLQPSDLVIIAARPSMGKTALALNIAAHAAARKHKAVAIFSLEMNKESLVLRLTCSESSVDSHTLRSGFASKEQVARAARAYAELSQTPLFIDDTAALNIMQIRAKARRLQIEHGQLDLMIVDYLQLITGHGRSENRNQEVSYISRGLKSIAKELHCPVVALSQLSRAPEAGKGREPQLSDLRDSGSIEQDADVVMFIQRDKLSADRGDEPVEGGDDPNYVPGDHTVEINIAKQRNGPTGSVRLVFVKKYTRFANLSHREPDGYL